MTALSHTLRFLGTGASCGVPSFYCGCKACEEALSNPAAQRGTAALLIRGAENTLIDAGPDLRMQLSYARAKDIKRVLLTHEHSDHIGGLPQLEFSVRLRSQEPLPVYAGKHTLDAIERQFPFMADTLELHCIEAWQTQEFDGVRYTALPATHGIQTFGFLIEAPASRVEGAVEEAEHTTGHKVAYFPDTALPTAKVLEQLKGIDTLIIDASFYGKNWMPTSHLSVDEAIELAGRVEAKKTFLTHLTMHYDQPITAAELQAHLASHKGRILAANDGLELHLS